MNYTREQAEEVLKDWNKFENNVKELYAQDIKFLDHKFPKQKSGWYRSTGPDEYLMYFDFENDNYYGFDGSGSWCVGMTTKGEYKKEYGYLATPQEVEERLIEEAKKRGFVEGVNFKTNWFKEDVICEVSNDKWRCDKNGYGFITLCQVGRPWIFKNGKWAEIIEQPETELSRTIKKAEKIATKLEKLLSSQRS